MKREEKRKKVGGADDIKWNLTFSALRELIGPFWRDTFVFTASPPELKVEVNVNVIQRCRDASTDDSDIVSFATTATQSSW